MTAPDFLATLRVLGYSPSQAAEAAGTTVRTAQRIVAGEQVPSLSMTLALHRHAELVRLGVEQRVPPMKRGPPKRAA